MEPVMETIGQAAAELEPALEPVIDYSEQLETIMLQLNDVISNQIYNGVLLADLQEELMLQREQLSVLTDLQKYVSGFALFFVIIALCVFVYKFFRMFF